MCEDCGDEHEKVICSKCKEKFDEDEMFYRVTGGFRAYCEVCFGD